MEWIRISTHKLKIMLNEEDARRYALSCTASDYAAPDTKAAFREILTDIRQETGFEAGDDRLYIQMYPSKTGGCELFVTRLGLAYEAEGAAPSAPLSNTKSHPTVQKKTGALRFEALEELLTLCRAMASSYKGESEVWRDEAGAWWLLLTVWGEPAALRRDLRLLREYGELHDAASARTLLAEHGRAICPADAMQVFGRL